MSGEAARWVLGILLLTLVSCDAVATQSVQVKQKEVTAKFKDIPALPTIANPDYTSEVLGLKPHSPPPPRVVSKPPSTPQLPAAKEQKLPESSIAANSVPTQSAVFSGAPAPQLLNNQQLGVVKSNQQQSKTSEGKEKEADIHPISQFFGGVEQYDATSSVLNIKHNRFEKKPYTPPKPVVVPPKPVPVPIVPKQLPKAQELQQTTQPAAQPKAQPLNPTVTEKKPETPKQQTQPQTNAAHSGSVSEREKEVAIVPSYQYFGSVNKEYDVTSSILNIKNPKFVKKTNQSTPASPSQPTPHQPAQKTQPKAAQEKVHIFPKPRPPKVAPKVAPTQPKPAISNTEKPKTPKAWDSSLNPPKSTKPGKPVKPATRPSPSKLPEVIDIQLPIDTVSPAAPKQVEQSRTFVMKVCSVVIIGFALLKFVQWRKSQRPQIELQEDAEQAGQFSGMGQQTGLQVDTETRLERAQPQ